MKLKTFLKILYLKWRINLARAGHGGLDPTFAPKEGWDTIGKWEDNIRELQNL